MNEFAIFFGICILIAITNKLSVIVDFIHRFDRMLKAQEKIIKEELEKK